MERSALISLAILLVSTLAVSVHCYGEKRFDPLGEHIKAQFLNHEPRHESYGEALSEEYVPVYVGSQDGLKAGDKVDTLPGQPSNGVEFDQYSGYVTVDPTAGRALFYYFVESPENSSSKPLVLWLNGGPGCSSLGNGAMMELGPFRVKADGQTLHTNQYAWNNEANIIFLESPAGVGFSYSNTTSDYNLSGDTRTAIDSYAFLVNWLERFPEYKTRDFFITGESYAGHYVPQLAQLILHNNNNTNQTVINLKGVAIGNAWIDFETGWKGLYDFFWTHALISDEVNEGINLNCNFSSPDTVSKVCGQYAGIADEVFEDIFIYNIYAPFCDSSSNSSSGEAFDPCSGLYVGTYLNTPQVQKALHANVTSLPYEWSSCSSQIRTWKDMPLTVLPVIQELMTSGISVWIYSGDTDGRVPVTSTRQSINKLGTPVKTTWYPWYIEEQEDEVAGYAVEYENLTFVTVRGAGHFVPSYQPARALALFSSFLEGKPPPHL